MQNIDKLHRPKNVPFNDGLTRVEAADYLGLKISTLGVDASVGQLNIPFYKIGRWAIYRRTELDAWLLTRRTAPNLTTCVAATLPEQREVVA